MCNFGLHYLLHSICTDIQGLMSYEVKSEGRFIFPEINAIVYYLRVPLSLIFLKPCTCTLYS